MFNFSFGGDVEIYLIEITLGNKVVERNQMTTIGLMVQQQYMDICNAVGQDSRPMKCVISKKIQLENEKFFTYRVDFCNNSYIKEFGGFE